MPKHTNKNYQKNPGAFGAQLALLVVALTAGKISLGSPMPNLSNSVWMADCQQDPDRPAEYFKGKLAFANSAFILNGDTFSDAKCVKLKAPQRLEGSFEIGFPRREGFELDLNATFPETTPKFHLVKIVSADGGAEELYTSVASPDHVNRAQSFTDGKVVWKRIP